MSIIKFKKGDKVKLTEKVIKEFGLQKFRGATLEFKHIHHDKELAKDHIKKYGSDNVRSCSCCNYAVLKELPNEHFFIEEGDSELEEAS